MATIRLRDMTPPGRRGNLHPTGVYRDLTPAGVMVTIDIALADYVITITPEEWATFSSSVDEMIQRHEPRNIGG